VADTEQVEALAPERGEMVTSRKQAGGAGGGDGVRQLVARSASRPPKLSNRRAPGACLLAAVASARRGRAARATGLGQAEL
jgi:hypothetical protein